MSGNSSFSSNNGEFRDLLLEILQLEKHEIENLSFERIGKMLKKLDNREDGGFHSLLLAINGFDDIPKELYEIDVTRKYLKRLVLTFPHILFYISPLNEMNYQIITSLSDFKKIYTGPIHPNTYSEGNHQIEIKLPKEYKDKLTRSVKRHVNKVKPVIPEKDIQSFYNFINRL